MSWFSRKTDPASTPGAAWSQWAAAEPQRTEPLSVERLERIFEHKSWYYRLDEDGDLTGRWDNEIFTFMLRGPDRDILNIMGDAFGPSGFHALSATDQGTGLPSPASS